MARRATPREAESTAQRLKYFDGLDKPKRILIVDDHPEMLTGFLQQSEAFWPSWTVEIAADPESALQRLSAGSRAGVPALVSVDLGLPPDPDAPRVGLELLRRLHKDYTGISLAVHSALDVKLEVLHEIVAMPASYVRIRDLDSMVALAAVLPLLAQGFIVYSPSPASSIPQAIVTHPDPLNQDQWRLLRLVASTSPHRTFAQIAEDLRLTEGAVTAQIKNIAKALKDKRTPGFAELDISDGPRGNDPRANSAPNRYRGKLEEFYRAHHVRYGQQ